VTVEYQKDGEDTWTTEKPEVGSGYTVRVTIPESDNYGETVITKEIESVSKDDSLKDTVTVKKDLEYGDDLINAFDLPYSIDDDANVVAEYRPVGGDDDSWTTERPTELGTYEVRLNIEETANHSAVQIEGATIDVKAAATNRIELDIEDWTYGEEAKTPTATTQFDAKVTYQYKKVGEDDSKYTTDVPTNAGKYVVRATTEADAVYFGAGEATKEFTIAKAKVEKPAESKSTFTYDGNAKTYNVAESDLYTVSGNKQTQAGDYTVTITLNDTNNYEWADGTTAPLQYAFHINEGKSSSSGSSAGKWLAIVGVAVVVVGLSVGFFVMQSKKED
jgi:hypothetical protein